MIHTGQTDASTIAEMCEALHVVARKKSCAALNFARFDSLVCIVTRSREKSRSLPLSLTGLTAGPTLYGVGDGAVGWSNGELL